MPDTALQAHGIPHPAPHQRSTSHWLLICALFAAPAAWGLQLLLSYGLASRACYPRDAPLASLPASWANLPAGLAAINIAALLVAIAGMAAGALAWRQSHREAEGGQAELMHAGEGRTRFLAVWGLWGSAAFLVEILFSAVAVIGVPACTP